MEPEAVEFWLPFTPASLKNTPHRFTDANRAAKQRLLQQRETIGWTARLALGQRRSFGANNVGCHLDEFPREETVRVRVTDIGPPGKGPTGRGRDLGNIDDRQLVAISSARHVCDALDRTPETTSAWAGRTLDALLSVHKDLAEHGKITLGTKGKVATVLHTRGVI